MNYKEIILNRLLDKYEKSKAYLQKTNRRINIKADAIKQYDIEDYEEKVLFHEVVKELKRKKLIDFKWLKFNEENILDEIWLNKENVDMVYKEIGRDNPKLSCVPVLEQLENTQFKQEWLKKFKLDMIKYMKENQKENSFLPKNLANDIIMVLEEIDKMQCFGEKHTVLKRVISVREYNDSKYFEKEVESYVIRIARRYYNNEDLDLKELNNTEILAEIGIVSYPEVIEFCGNMTCDIKGEKVNFFDVTLGNYLNSFAIQYMENVKLVNVKKIIFIENKANYIDYIQNKKEDEFVVYHGGVYSPIKGEFFRKIYQRKCSGY